MIWALKEGERITAFPKQRAICELCNQEVISKCGEIKIWHWAHKQEEDCDKFGEPETAWHFEWKKKFPEENQEIRIDNHRADIRTSKGVIIELQNSPISLRDILERERTYKSLIWILNGKTVAKNIKFFKQRYKWRWFPLSWQSVRQNLYIDMGDMFLYQINPVNNVGEFKRISKDAFIIEHGGKPWNK